MQVFPSLPMVASLSLSETTICAVQSRKVFYLQINLSQPNQQLSNAFKWMSEMLGDYNKKQHWGLSCLLSPLRVECNEMAQ